MSDPNFLQQSSDFVADSAIDTTADSLINQVVDGVVSRIPGAEAIEPMLNTGIDQNVNNMINSEINKGLGGMLQDAAGLIHPQ
jgi:hypothetical protein